MLKKNVLKLIVQFQHIFRTTYKCFFFSYFSYSHCACEFASGRRTVNCCLDIAAIVYYLSYARYLFKTFKLTEVNIHGLRMTMKKVVFELILETTQSCR